MCCNYIRPQGGSQALPFWSMPWPFVKANDDTKSNAIWMPSFQLRYFHPQQKTNPMHHHFVIIVKISFEHIADWKKIKIQIILDDILWPQDVSKVPLLTMNWFFRRGIIIGSLGLAEGDLVMRCGFEALPNLKCLGVVWGYCFWLSLWFPVEYWPFLLVRKERRRVFRNYTSY